MHLAVAKCSHSSWMCNSVWLHPRMLHLSWRRHNTYKPQLGKFSVSWKAEHPTFLSFDFSPTVAFTVWTLQFGIFVNLAIKIPSKFSANCSNSPCWIYRPITSHNSNGTHFTILRIRKLGTSLRFVGWAY